MDYFSILNLTKEPFSNSPDPDAFFQSRQHVDCLQKLELALRLKRGLNVVLGDVGTGKTTLCRQLLRKFGGDDRIEAHLILDPDFNNSGEFLKTVADMLRGRKRTSTSSNDWQIKEEIKQLLFQKGVADHRTVVLIIDEGQKIPVFCLELLREFLNYETNEHKLLQIVIFAQQEFKETLSEHSNFADRINLYHTLKPMSFRDTRRMIQFRLQEASAPPATAALFTLPALWAIYRATRGYPRKIINLCHRCVLAMIIQNRTRGNWRLVRSGVRRSFPVKRLSTPWQATLILVAVVLLVLLVDLLPEDLRIEPPDGVSPSYNREAAINKAPVVTYKIPPRDKNIVPPVDSSAARTKTAEAKPPVAPDPQVLRLHTAAAATPTAASAPQNDFKDGLPPVTEDRQAPLYLGRVSLNPDETLGEMIQKIYGQYNNRYLAAVARANPQIKDPDSIRSGETILFPARTIDPEPLPVPIWWVALDQTETLEAAYARLRQLAPRLPETRLIPHWNPKEGLTFTLILNRYFFDGQSAQMQIDKLDDLWVPEARVVASWEADNIFFANPY